MDLLLSVLVLAALAFLVGGFVLWRKGAPRLQPVLMVVVAAILIANVLILTLPYANGECPAEEAQALGR